MSFRAIRSRTPIKVFLKGNIRVAILSFILGFLVELLLVCIEPILAIILFSAVVGYLFYWYVNGGWDKDEWS